MESVATAVPEEGPTVAITGAGGFVGRCVVGAALSAGLKVRALLRTRHGAAELRRAGADVRIVSLEDSKALADALGGASVLIHLAYDMRASGARNLATFHAVMEAAGQAGIKRIVQASSAVVYDDWPNGAIDEDSAIGDAPEGSYRWAKIVMEKWLMSSSFSVAILQPTIVYGPGSALWTDGPMAALRRGDVVLPEPAGFCAALFVDDLATAVVRAAVVPELGRRRFLISGDEMLSWRDFWEGYARLVGKGGVRTAPAAQLAARLGPAAEPGSIAPGPSAAARVSAGLRRLLGRRRFEALRSRLAGLRRSSSATYPDRGALQLYSGRAEVSIRRAQEELDFAPKVRFVEGLARIQAQYR